jgi:ribosomal protein S27AE
MSTTTRPKMISPKCGSKMNEHAEKLVDPTNPQEAALADPALGGIVEEFHTCPNCGANASRRALN